MIKLKKILVLFSITIVSFAQANDGSAILDKLQNKYNTINDFTSSFKQITQNNQTSTGKFYYKVKDKFRIELNSRTIVGDGKTVWNYSPKNKKIIITSADDDANSFSIDDYVFNFPAQCKVSSLKNDDGRDVLVLRPKTSDLDFAEIKLLINKNYLIDQIGITDLMSNTSKVDLENTKINQNLSDKLFTFDIPQGTQIIDLR